MSKKKTLKKQEFSLNDMPELKLKNNKEVIKVDTKKIKNKSFISKALWQCMIDNDVESFKEILKAHLEMTNKVQLAEETGISRRTLYRMLSPEGNPSLENVTKIIHKLCA
jgi:probable addiction module antidote protein